MSDSIALFLSNLQERIALALGRLAEPPYLYGTLGVLFGLVAILYLIRRYRRAHRPIIPFRAEGGDVEIAPQTIRGLINGTVKSVPGVKSATSRYEQRGRKLRLRIFIHLQATAKLVEVQQEIKRRIRLALHAHIGMEPNDIDPIRVKVIKIVGEPDPRNTATLALPSAPRQPSSDTPIRADEDFPAGDELLNNRADENSSHR